MLVGDCFVDQPDRTARDLTLSHKNNAESYCGSAINSLSVNVLSFRYVLFMLCSCSGWIRQRRRLRGWTKCCRLWYQRGFPRRPSYRRSRRMGRTAAARILTFLRRRKKLPQGEGVTLVIKHHEALQTLQRQTQEFCGCPRLLAIYLVSVLVTTTVRVDVHGLANPTKLWMPKSVRVNA